MAFGNIGRIYFVALIVLIASSLMPVGVQAQTMNDAATAIFDDIRQVQNVVNLASINSVENLLNEFTKILIALKDINVPKLVVSLGIDGGGGESNFATGVALVTPKNQTNEGGVCEVAGNELKWHAAVQGESVTVNNLFVEAKKTTGIEKAFTTQHVVGFNSPQMITCHNDFVAIRGDGAKIKSQTFVEGTNQFVFSFANVKNGFNAGPVNTIQMIVKMTPITTSTAAPGGGGGRGGGGAGASTTKATGGKTSGKSYTGTSTTSSASEFGATCAVVASSIAISLVANIVA